MAIYKNKTSQKVACFAYDSILGTAKTGDSANITAQISLDGAATAATNDTNPTELDATDAPGIYIFDLQQAETNADLIVLVAVSGTSGILIEPLLIYTEPEIRSAIVNLVDGAITADKFDQITAFPTIQTDVGNTKIARTGADSDTLETISDQIDDIPNANGPGADSVTIKIKVGSGEIADASVWISTDLLGRNVIAGTLQTNSSGNATFLLDHGVTYFLHMRKDGVKSIQGEQFVAQRD